MAILIKNGTIVNEGLSYIGSLLIVGNKLTKIIVGEENIESKLSEIVHNYTFSDDKLEIIDATGLYVLPGVIDDQVHFREPGNTQKGCIESESKAAVLGGVTSFMDMPNNNPSITSNAMLEEKFKIAKQNSYANYSFYLGASNTNLDEILNVDKSKVCGIKVFMGSSTGNMLVDNTESLKSIFAQSPILIATHCEKEETIKANLDFYKSKYGENISINLHPDIRSREACISSSKQAIKLAQENGSRLHILHLSTADEIELIKQAQKEEEGKVKKAIITGEICVHYLLLNREDYAKYGNKIKCNPAIKEKEDMLALRKAVKDGVIKVVATDHAPHLKSEKEKEYLKAPGGLPLVQHSLQLMLQLVKNNIFTVEEVVDRMSHGPAQTFGIKGRGYIRENYYADLTIVNLNLEDTKTTTNPAYKCGWSPFEGQNMSSSIIHTIINGCIIVRNGVLTGNRNVQNLEFEHK